ncbi:uncharacterized protein N7515_002079 [Penicillium bovifimosum]|uniref:Uncharacterized protein n=1 Tax=Penicillium bovifimosum TaxID=126998 RepID=A0A9W9HAX0_9EURO|nr:uncharacterized protein N7515_002079 [Penicillium bovifimosum]KAJ5143292.1 hypothetical protein N7515_002079 [Penicillium bovifimosum]
MPSPPSQMLQQLRLSEQKEDLSQRKKSDHHGHKSTMGRRAVLTGAVVKALPMSLRLAEQWYELGREVLSIC